MKFSNIIIITILSVFLLPSLMKAQTAIQVTATCENDQVKLRWLPPTFAQMKHAINYGYHVERLKLKDASGNDISEEDIDTFSFNVFPYTESEWQQVNLIEVEKKAAAKELLGDMPILSSSGARISLDTIPLGSRKLSHAYNNTKTQENQYSFAAIIADQDFNLAVGMGFGMIDLGDSGLPLLENTTYQYRVSLNNQSEFLLNNPTLSIDAGICEVLISSTSSLPIVPNLSAEGGNKKVRLTWDTPNLNPYTYYNIYRVDQSSASFDKVNVEPYIYLTADENATFATYNDSIPLNGVTYTYKVCGISPFGGEGPFSDLVTVSGTPDPLPLAIEITSVTDVNGKLGLSWNAISKLDSLPPDMSLVTGYEIVYSPDLQVDPIVVRQVSNSSTLSDSIVSPQDGYYIVEALDANGFRYPSIPHLHQGVDSFPPAKPIGLTTRLNLDGTVLLNWTPNVESDLLGYRVFYSYYPTGPFNQMSSDPIKENRYVAKSIENNANDSVYYAIKAIDQRENASEMSDYTMLAIPDKSGPSRPVISQVIPRPEGIRIGWQLSPDPDVDRHFLQRKVTQATKWDNIMEIRALDQFPPLAITPAEVNASNYVDTDTLELRKYNYRIIVYDLTGNYSVSDVYEVRPYDDGIRGSVTSFSAEQVKSGQYYTPVPQGAGQNGGSQTVLAGTNIGNQNQGFIKGSMTSDGKVAKLIWDYQTQFPSSLKDFSIYQKVQNTVQSTGTTPVNTSNNPVYVLIKTISKTDAIRIAMANGSTGYMSFIEGINPEKMIPLIPIVSIKPITGATSAPGAVVSPFEYKIIANHTDGGWSNEAITPLVTKE